MKLEELFENKRAATHVNADRSLSIIPSLLQKSFGLNFNNIEGTCLAAQMIWSMATVSGIDPVKLVQHINRSGLTGPNTGVTFQSLFALLNDTPIKIGPNQSVKFSMSVSNPSIDEVIQDVQSGQPVLAIFNSGIYNGVGDDISRMQYAGSGPVSQGIVSDNAIKNTTTTVDSGGRYFHTLLVMGYDNKAQQLIARETRSGYGFKGYAKIPVKAIRKNPKSFRFLTVNVDSVTPVNKK